MGNTEDEENVQCTSDPNCIQCNNSESVKLKKSNTLVFYVNGQEVFDIYVYIFFLDSK